MHTYGLYSAKARRPDAVEPAAGPKEHSSGVPAAASRPLRKATSTPVCSSAAASGGCYRRDVRPDRRTNWRALALVALVSIAVCALAAVALATPGARNPDVIADTVYDGAFAASQNTWGGIQVQFVVTAGEKVTEVAPAEAFCAPGNGVPLSSATINNDAFSVETSEALQGFHVTISGTFITGGKARGTGRLEAETIESKPCDENGSWTATALPKGTQLCPDVDPGLLPRPTVTDMSCAKAALAFAAGVRESEKNGPSSEFNSPGYTCTSSGGDPDVREICTRGSEVFRLP